MKVEPELKEAIKRLKRKEPELEVLTKRKTKKRKQTRGKNENGN